MRIVSKVLSLLFLGGGLLLIVNAGLPILSYEIFSSPNFRKSQLLSPAPGPQAKAARDIRDAYPLDLTRASNWFVDSYAEDQESIAQGVKYYTLSIPKLGIERAAAEIGGEDLSENLIHYRGTALPGRAGNAVIFGHSILPQFFNPKNYLSIFSTLPTLEKGDLVKVNYDGVLYTYKIEEMFEVMPKDIQVLEQRYDDSYITLITCVPPGTYLRRLVVKGRLIPPEQVD